MKTAHKSALLVSTALALGVSEFTLAQNQGDTPKTPQFALEQIVVVARRREENLQEVPISVQVFKQEQLDNLGVVSVADLAKFVPSLSTNNRFGSDVASFNIRGFTQDLRTAPAVGIYFADVIMPRGFSATTLGDGAGPGSFFDLQNVQVIKGPQGTLFGRNTTGGAVLLVPNEPSDEIGGYVEGSTGNYNMKRYQGVFNAPLSENVFFRGGVDSMKRDGYMDNISGIGPTNFNNIDYTSARGSLIWDITPDLQNYAIGSYTDSHNNGPLIKVTECNPDAPTGFLVCPQVEREEGGKYNASNSLADPVTKMKVWQGINTTNWNINENLTVKNILSYAELKIIQRQEVFGTDWIVPFGAYEGEHTNFAVQTNKPGLSNNNQSTFVEEFQLQGESFDEKLTWQTGVYYEYSEPVDPTSGTRGPGVVNCTDILDTSTCYAPLGRGAVVEQTLATTTTTLGLYGQGTFDLTDTVSLTAGARYNDDESKSDFESFVEEIGAVPGVVTKTYCRNNPADLDSLPAQIENGCREHIEQHDDKVTYLAGVEYQPISELMSYAKYTRGYRQGLVNPSSSVPGLQSFEPETVDSYEVGVKTSWEAQVPGSLNLAVFYNDLKNQQLLIGYLGTVVQTGSAIQNAGASEIKGFELDGNFILLDNLSLSFGYAYLDTELKELEVPPIPPLFDTAFPQSKEGYPSPYTPKNKFFVGLNYILPVPADMGEVTAGINYTYTDDYTSSASELGVVESNELVNLAIDWTSIAGSAFDLTVFATNLMDQYYFTDSSDLFVDRGILAQQVGEPRMIGAKLRYRFGADAN